MSLTEACCIGLGGLWNQLKFIQADYSLILVLIIETLCLSCPTCQTGETQALTSLDVWLWGIKKHVETSSKALVSHLSFCLYPPLTPCILLLSRNPARPWASLSPPLGDESHTDFPHPKRNEPGFELEHSSTFHLGFTSPFFWLHSPTCPALVGPGWWFDLDLALTKGLEAQGFHFCFWFLTRWCSFPENSSISCSAICWKAVPDDWF